MADALRGGGGDIEVVTVTTVRVCVGVEIREKS